VQEGILEAGIRDEREDRMDARSRDGDAATLVAGRRYATVFWGCVE